MNISSPYRAIRSYTQHLAGTPDEVFPLLCPVREADWIEGWDPIAVWSDSGFAEQDCVFTTASGDGEAVWYVTRHEPAAGFVEMIKVTPGVTACRLTIELTANVDSCDALVTYRHTSLGPAGDALVDGFTQAYYDGFMREWESRLNHYLATGKCLSLES